MLALRPSAPMVCLMDQASTIAVFKPSAQALPVVLSCPHAGTMVPDDLVAATTLDEATLIGATDFGVDALVEPAAHALGVPLVSCLVARAYVDVNRSEDEIDTAMFKDIDALPPHRARSPRCHQLCLSPTFGFDRNCLIHGSDRIWASAAGSCRDNLVDQ